jgi:hypothetical protein
MKLRAIRSRGRYVEKTKEMLFSIQKFQILALFTNASAERGFTESYVYAWSEGVYPFLNKSAPWHQPFEACFPVGEQQLRELHEFLQERLTQKKKLTFVQLEDHYGIRGPRRPGPVWDQANLVRACRYFFLGQQFGSGFWSALLANGQYPAVAEVISTKFSPELVQFE